MVPSAVSNAAKNVRWAPPLVDEWRPAWTACFIGGPSDPRGLFWQGRLVWLGAARWCASIAPRLPSAKQTGTPPKCSCDAVRMISVFFLKSSLNKFQGRMFAAMPSRLYARRRDGLHRPPCMRHRGASAPCLRRSRAIGLAMNAASVRRNRQFSACDHYILTFLARPLKLLEWQQVNTLQEWRRRECRLHYRAADSRLRRVSKLKYRYSREG
jgi:hypothetical protein